MDNKLNNGYDLIRYQDDVYRACSGMLWFYRKLLCKIIYIKTREWSINILRSKVDCSSNGGLWSLWQLMVNMKFMVKKSLGFGQTGLPVIWFDH